MILYDYIVTLRGDQMHALLDKVTVKSTSLMLGKKKFFRSSLSTPGYRELLEEGSLDIPPITEKGTYEVPFKSPVGLLDPAFDLVQWKGDHLPTIIYHHGNNERPFNYKPWEKNSFFKIFNPRMDELEANLFNIRAPFHNSFKLYLEKIAHLDQFLAMLTASVRLVQELVIYSREKGSPRILVSGISLGAWVATLHRAFFNTADSYVPLLGGPRPADIFLNSIYSQLVAPGVLKNREAVASRLDFVEEFSRHEEKNVFPLLAIQDQIIRYEVQKEAYSPYKVAEINRGHTTGFLAGKDLREHIEIVLSRD